MITVAVLFLVAFVIAKIGIWLINAGMPKEQPYDQAAEDRMIKYRAYIRGVQEPFGRGCLGEKHSPMVLFNPKDPTRVDCVICSICSDTLPRPAKYSCGHCSFTTVDGYILEDLCDRHGDKVLA